MHLGGNDREDMLNLLNELPNRLKQNTNSHNLVQKLTYLQIVDRVLYCPNYIESGSMLPITVDISFIISTILTTLSLISKNTAPSSSRSSTSLSTCTREAFHVFSTQSAHDLLFRICECLVRINKWIRFSDQSPYDRYARQHEHQSEQTATATPWSVRNRLRESTGYLHVMGADKLSEIDKDLRDTWRNITGPPAMSTSVMCANIIYNQLNKFNSSDLLFDSIATLVQDEKNRCLEELWKKLLQSEAALAVERQSREKYKHDEAELHKELRSAIHVTKDDDDLKKQQQLEKDKVFQHEMNDYEYEARKRFVADEPDNLLLSNDHATPETDEFDAEMAKFVSYLFEFVSMLDDVINHTCKRCSSSIVSTGGITSSMINGGKSSGSSTIPVSPASPAGDIRADTSSTNMHVPVGSNLTSTSIPLAISTRTKEEHGVVKLGTKNKRITMSKRSNGHNVSNKGTKRARKIVTKNTTMGDNNSNDTKEDESKERMSIQVTTVIKRSDDGDDKDDDNDDDDNDDNDDTYAKINEFPVTNKDEQEESPRSFVTSRGIVVAQFK